MTSSSAGCTNASEFSRRYWERAEAVKSMHDHEHTKQHHEFGCSAEDQVWSRVSLTDANLTPVASLATGFQL